jgi:ribonuclease HII
VRYSAGLDDAGRGSLAGPLVICTLWHPNPDYVRAIGATDSKDTTVAERALFVRKLKHDGRALLGFAAAEAAMINVVGTLNTEHQVTRSAIDQLLHLLGVEPGGLHVRIDGSTRVKALDPALSVEYLPQGDRYDPLIAGASMVARALLDALMAKLDAQHPGWGLARHQGYYAPDHIERLIEHGPQPFHRLRAAKTAVLNHVLKHKLPPPAWLTQPACALGGLNDLTVGS